MPVGSSTSIREPAWIPLVDAQTRTHAIDVAQVVASRFRDREFLLRTNRRASEQSRYPDTLRWNPCALAHGDAGLALACAYFDRCWPGDGWDEAADKYLSHATRSARLVEVRSGLFGGLAGLAFAAHNQPATSIARRELLPAIDQVLASRVLEMARNLHGRHGIAVSDFDTISGLAGIGAYLITNGASPPTDVAYRALLDALVSMTSTTSDVPHWFTPQHLMGDQLMSAAYPLGNMNCGLAHGIPGPLALMALALRKSPEYGDSIDGLPEAVERVAEWLVRHQMHDDFGINWPTFIPLTAGGRPEAGPIGSRAAWCYGAPGVARSLWLAGSALGNTALCELAIEAMAAIYRRPLALREINSPTFCHGVAGLLQITLRFAHDTGEAFFREAATELCKQVLSEFRDEQPLGFCSVEPGGNRVDQCGLLDGAAGVSMVLLAASTCHRPSWDRAFLLN